MEPKKQHSAKAVLWGPGPGVPAWEGGDYLPLFLARLATFFCLAVFAGVFLVCFLEFWDLAILYLSVDFQS